MGANSNKLFFCPALSRETSKWTITGSDRYDLFSRYGAKIPNYKQYQNFKFQFQGLIGCSIFSTLKGIQPGLTVHGVPVIAWSPFWDENPFFISLNPDSNNGLQKKSAVDCFQIRAISHNRFVEKVGNISNDEIDLIKKSIALILDIEPEHCE